MEQVKARIIEGFENKFYKDNEAAIIKTNNWGYFANDRVPSSVLGRVRDGNYYGTWIEYNYPSPAHGAAWLLLKSPISENLRTQCAKSKDGTYEFKLTNGARSYFSIAPIRDKEDNITHEEILWTIPNDETNPKTEGRYFKFPFTTKPWDSNRRYTFDNCKTEKGSLPYMVENNRLIELLPPEVKQLIGLEQAKEIAASKTGIVKTAKIFDGNIQINLAAAKVIEQGTIGQIPSQEK